MCDCYRGEKGHPDHEIYVGGLQVPELKRIRAEHADRPARAYWAYGPDDFPITETLSVAGERHTRPVPPMRRLW